MRCIIVSSLPGNFDESENIGRSTAPRLRRLADGATRHQSGQAGRTQPIRAFLTHSKSIRSQPLMRDCMICAMAHVAHYAGWPVALQGFRCIERVYGPREPSQTQEQVV